MHEPAEARVAQRARDATDPFATLGIAPSFDVDLRALEKTHRQLSRAFHPDRFVGSTPGQKRQALARAVEVNEAWRVVRDPLRRAEALLALRGIASGEAGEPSPDPEFLSEILEQREALAEARGARDGEAVRRLADAMRARSATIERELSAGLVAGEADELLRAIAKFRFYRRFLDEVSAAEDGIA
jgi:molecular chaperone HscB